MTDILGAISASLDLAIFMTKQVEKIIDAPKTVRVITDDVARLGRILSQLRNTLEPDSRAGHKAIRLKPAGLRNGLESVRRCEHTLERLEDALTNIFGNGSWSRLKAELQSEDRGHVEPIRFGTRARAIFAYREGDILKLMAELKECKWDIMLSNSVNQLYLAQQYPQLHAQDSEKLDYLQMLCESIAMQKRERQKSDTAPKPPPYKPFNPPGGIFNADSVHVPGGDKGLEPHFPPKQPTGQTPQAQDLAASKFIRRARRINLEENVLNVERIRWLNDPFDRDFINIHESMTEDRLRELEKLSIKFRVSREGGSLQYTAPCEVVEEVAERTSKLEQEITARKEEERLVKKLRVARNENTNLRHQRDKYQNEAYDLRRRLAPSSEPDCMMSGGSSHSSNGLRRSESRRHESQEQKERLLERINTANPPPEPSVKDPARKQRRSSMSQKRSSFIQELQADDRAARGSGPPLTHELESRSENVTKTTSTASYDTYTTESDYIPERLPPNPRVERNSSSRKSRKEQEFIREHDLTSSYEMGSSSESQAAMRNNLVADLINQWIISPEEPEEPRVTLGPESSKCDRHFERGDRMYSCPVCGLDDEKVFCSDCFNEANHKGHGSKMETATGDTSFCDCGHLDAVKRRLTCQIHGTMDPEDYKARKA